MKSLCGCVPVEAPVWLHFGVGISPVGFLESCGMVWVPGEKGVEGALKKELSPSRHWRHRCVLLRWIDCTCCRKLDCVVKGGWWM